MHNTTKPRIGLFGIGLEAYWDQFEGLQDRLVEYIDIIAGTIANQDAELINLGLVDSTDKAFKAGLDFKKEDVDLIFLYVTTYALSATVLPVISKAKVPVVILNLSPEASIDYASFNKMEDRTAMTGEWLAHCSACSLPELANVFLRSGIPFYQITGMLQNDPHVLSEITEWIAAARVTRTMYYNRLGVMGNYYGGMLDIYSDMTLQCSTFGGHIEILEVDELSALKSEVTEAEVQERIQVITQQFEVQADCLPEELHRAAKTSVALDKMVALHNLGSLAYYHKGTGSIQNVDTMTSIIVGNSLLTSRNIPVAGEYEIKNVQAMKIMDTFGVGGSFTEYYAMDYNDDVVLMGHDGPCHPQIAEGKIKVKPLKVYHGKIGSGLSVEMSVSYGPVTLLSVAETGTGKLKFIVAEAESVPGPILEIGNTNSRYKFPSGARNFVESWNAAGPAHHCAIGKGHIAAKIAKLGKMLNVEVKEIK